MMGYSNNNNNNGCSVGSSNSYGNYYCNSNLSALAPPFSITSTLPRSSSHLHPYSPNPSAPILRDAAYHFSPATSTTTNNPSSTSTYWASQPRTTTPDYYPPTAPTPYHHSQRPDDYIYALDWDTPPFSSSPGPAMDYGTSFKQDTTLPTPSTTHPYTHMDDLSFLPSASPTNTSPNTSAYHNAFPTYVSPFTRQPPPPTRPSSSVVIRSPPVITTSPSAPCNHSLSPAVITNFDLAHISHSQNNDKDFFHLSNQSFVSPSPKEFSTPLNASQRTDKTSHEPPFPNVNVSNGIDTVQAVTAAEVSSDSADLHSIGVDSPCWRGVNSAQFSPLYVEDDLSGHYYKNSVDELYDIGQAMKDNICSVIDSTTTSVCVGEVNKNQETECAQNGVIQKVQRNLDAAYPARETNSAYNTEPEGRVSTRSIGVQIDKDPDMPIKESGLPNNWMRDFDMNNSNSKFFIGKVDTSFTLSDVSAGNIAVHAAEKVLASPSSQEDTADGTRVQPDPKMAVTRIIESMHSLSESLLLHLPNDSSPLEEKSTECLKLIINNLSSCMSRNIIKPTTAPNLNYPIGDDSKTGESLDKITILDKPHKSRETNDSQTDRDYWSMYDEVGDVSGKKAENSPGFSLSRDDSDITGDGMTKAIKKVLDENLNLDEEIHPQALLFKSLWLEAEAKLCSISYRARFDRMKLQIEKSKSKTHLGKGGVAEEMAKNYISPNAHDDAGIKPMIRSSYLPKTSSHAEDAETSFMSRLSILKSRDVGIEDKQKSVIADADGGDFVMDRLKILKSRADNTKSLNVEVEKLPERSSGGQGCLGTCVRDQPADTAKSDVAPRPHLRGTGNYSEGNFGSGHKSLKELNSSMANDQMIHPLYDARMMNQPYAGWRGSSSSSDWEHVLKDDFAWKNS